MVPSQASSGPGEQVRKVAQAIAKAEGYGLPGAIPTRAHNPGDLCLGDKGYGTIGEGVTIFGTVIEGWSALYREVELMLFGESHVYSPLLTLEQVGMKYSGGNPDWAKNVAEALGVPATITLAELAARPGSL